MYSTIIVLSLIVGSLGRKIYENDQYWVSKVSDVNFGLRTSNVKHTPESQRNTNKNAEMHQTILNSETNDQIIYISSNEDGFSNHQRRSFNNPKHNNNHHRIETGFSNTGHDEYKLKDNQSTATKSLVTNIQKLSHNNDVLYASNTTNNKPSDQPSRLTNTKSSESSKEDDIISNNTSIKANIAADMRFKYDPNRQIYNQTVTNQTNNAFKGLLNNNRRVTNANNDNINQRKSSSTDYLSNSENKSTDNEVLVQTNHGVSPSTYTGDEDRWIWSNGVLTKTTTTTIPPSVGLDDRAAFTGDKCPTGKAKLGKDCVELA